MPTHQISDRYTPRVVNSTGTATAMVATLATVAGKMTYCTGFDIEGSGATAASVINATLAGGLDGTLTFTLNVVSPATVAVNALGGLSVRFPDPLPASAPGTAFTLSVPSFGAGATNATVNLYGLIPQ